MDCFNEAPLDIKTEGGQSSLVGGSERDQRFHMKLGQGQLLCKDAEYIIKKKKKNRKADLPVLMLSGNNREKRNKKENAVFLKIITAERSS